MTTQYRQVPTYGQPLMKGTNTTAAWYRYVQDLDLGIPFSAESAVTPTGSPFTYTAPQAGQLIVSGGTVSAITYSRSGTFYATGQTAGMFSLSARDQLQITYSSAPTLTWAPR